MARKNPLKCSIGTKRFTVIQVGSDIYDTHAGRSFEAALRSAQPDHGDRLRISVVCARDAGEARLKDGKLIKYIRYKRGG